MAYLLKYQPESAFEDGVFVPFRTQEEAERQIANDAMNEGALDRFDGIVKATYPAPANHRNMVWLKEQETYDPDHPMVKAAWRQKHEIIADSDQVMKLIEKHQEALVNERIQAHVDFALKVDKATKALAKGYDKMTASDKKLAVELGMIPQAVVPGNAYTVVSGGTATAGAIALAAATAKTVIGVASGSANQASLVECVLSFDGVSATAVPVLCEWVSGTNATNAPGTASTSQTPKQVRGWPAQTSQATGAYNWTTEPTVLEVWKKALLTPNGGLLVLQWPLGREPTGFVTASTQFKFMGLRLTAPATVNVHVSLEYEE